MCKIEESCTIGEQVKEIHDVLLGENLHTGSGIIDRISKLEVFKATINNKIAYLAGASAFVGVIIGAIIMEVISL